MPHMQPQPCDNGCCPPLPPIDCCEQEGLLVDVSLTLSDFDYSCSQAGPAPWDGFGATYRDFIRQVTLSDLSGTYTTQTTFDGCSIGDFSLEIGEITLRVYSEVKVTNFASTIENHWFSDKTWTGLLKLERVDGVTKFNLYDNVRTSATVYYRRNGVLHNSIVSEVRCLGPINEYDFPPCYDPIHWQVLDPFGFRYYMDFLEENPDCYTQPDGMGGLVFVYEPGEADVRFWLPTFAVSARGFDAFRPPDFIADSHFAIPIFGQVPADPSCSWPENRQHVWANALTYTIVPP